MSDPHGTDCQAREGCDRPAALPSPYCYVHDRQVVDGEAAPLNLAAAEALLIDGLPHTRAALGLALLGELRQARRRSSKRGN